MEAEAEVQELFARAGARVYMSVAEIGTDRRFDIDADVPVVVASAIKIIFCLAFAREVAAGRIDDRERVEVPARLRIGGQGTEGARDPVQMSLHDLAWLMMTLSDNAATDVIYDRVGSAPITAVINDLRLSGTVVRGNMSWLRAGIVDELGLADAVDLDAQLAQADPEAIWRLAWLDPDRTNCATPAEIGALLAAIWTDAAGPSEACAFVRAAMGAQLTTHRLAAGFPDPDVRVAGKTGTVPSIRNEAGVIAYPDGRRYTAAIFTRAESLAPRRPAIDIAIGTAARLAIEHLRTL